MPVTKKQIEEAAAAKMKTLDDALASLNKKVDEATAAAVKKADDAAATFKAELKGIEDFLGATPGDGYTAEEIAKGTKLSQFTVNVALGFLQADHRCHIHLNTDFSPGIPLVSYFAGPAPAR